MSKNKAGQLNLREVAREAGLEAVKEYKRQEREKARNKRFHNMGLLMENYLDFVDFAEGVKYKASDIKESLDPEEFDEAYLDDIYIESVKRSKLRTIILINMIETAVEKIENTTDISKFKAFKLIYMDKQNKQYKFNERLIVVGEQCNCSDRTVRRWVNDILSELSKKLIGAERMLSDL